MCAWGWRKEQVGRGGKREGGRRGAGREGGKEGKREEGRNGESVCLLLYLLSLWCV